MEPLQGSCSNAARQQKHHQQTQSEHVCEDREGQRSFRNAKSNRKEFLFLYRCVTKAETVGEYR